MDKELAGAALAAYFDHTALKPETTFADIVKLCSEAKDHGFATVCVNPYWVGEAKEQLMGTGVGITTVIGFPLGANSTFVKVAETRDALASGATEIDMVLNVGALKSGRLEAVEKDVQAVAEACQGLAVLKVILEVGLLTDEEKVTASEICKRAGADYVKTSTGFGPGGATVKDVALMRKTVGPKMGVKASGGVRDLESALALIAAGATRIGASAGVAIVNGGKGEGY